MVEDLHFIKKFHKENMLYWQNNTNPFIKQEVKDMITLYHKEAYDKAVEFENKLMAYANS